jgi:hypothetical protein
MPSLTQERAAKMRQQGEYKVDAELLAMEEKCSLDFDRMLTSSPTRSGVSTPRRSPVRSPSLHQSLNGPISRRRSPHSSPLAKSVQEFSARDLHHEEQ